MLKGWGVRPYNWTATASFQHELRPSVGLTADYFRRWYGNFRVTDNLRVTPADYDPYCVTAPGDSRLPGGGGNQVCGFYDIKPTAFGAVHNLVTRALEFRQADARSTTGSTSASTRGSGRAACWPAA